ncbi:hypothetical protein HMPREF0454_03884 [Hafnia alvei ATCC 51873]|uniref:Uncharacterized protein n=1 Tax=Hafnia alvei ATCC 51873 TaxID=1002364 RepID=G9YBA5_HAFAL|nr:hypothetical protein HMPREF0454_03884 [Hafnia alvei ATCC 51873]
MISLKIIFSDTICLQCKRRFFCFDFITFFLYMANYHDSACVKVPNMS